MPNIGSVNKQYGVVVKLNKTLPIWLNLDFASWLIFMGESVLFMSESSQRHGVCSNLARNLFLIFDPCC